jgi:NADH:ubiquinone oxidoreductase subunit F (NADH-binding)
VTAELTAGRPGSSSVPAGPTAPAGLPRLLAPADQLAGYGPLPPASGEQVIRMVEAAGLTGRGGAGFPTHRKLRAVAAGRSPVVVGNGAEGEPASRKDAVLLGSAPGLVLDGLQLAARAVGARRAYLYVHAGSAALPAIRAALAEPAGRRLFGSGPVPVTLVEAPPRFLAGEESALANRISGGPAIPRAVPPRVFQRGVAGRATLVQNVETLAQLALIVRFGPDWYRAIGTGSEPGSALFTVGGAVAAPGVVEAALGTPVPSLLSAAGGTTGPLQAVLFGGYHGAWLPAADAEAARLTVADLRSRGATLGAGVVVALPATACGVAETARVLGYLAGESARQCGPCLNGLPAIATALAQLAGPGGSPSALARIRRWADMIDGRGACHHPDGAVRFLRSAVRTFGREFDLHAHGRCTTGPRPPVLPITPPPTGPADWS